MSYPYEDHFRRAPLPRITIPRIRRVPEPPALLARPPRGMAQIPALVNYLDGTPSGDGARFRLVYDDAALAVAGWLDAPTHGRSDIVEDPAEHEQLHVLLNPTPERDRWYRIRLRPGSIVALDAGGEGVPPAPWLNAGAVAIERDGSGWRFAARIPFSSLGEEPPSPATMWRVNVFRVFTKRQEDDASWSLMSIGRPDIVERYGEIVFGGIAGWLSDTALGPRGGHATFVLANAGARSVVATIVARADRGAGAATGVVVSAGRWTAVRLDLPATDGGGFVVEACAGRRVIARAIVASGLPPLGDRLAALRRRMSELTVPHEVSRAADGVARFLVSPDRTVSGWRRAERSLARAEYVAGLARYRSSGASAAIRAETSLRKVFPARPLPEKLGRRIDLIAPRRGHDAAQVVAAAFDRPLRGCVARVESLSGPEGATIPAEAIEISIVGAVTTRPARYTVDYAGPHPDPLLPIAPFDVPAWTHRTLWLTIAVPDDMPAGAYRGAVVVESADGIALRMPVTFRVRDFALPVETTLRTAFPVFETEFATFYGRPLDAGGRRALYEFLLRRRISPSCQYDAVPLPRAEDAEEAVAGGANVVSTGYLRAEEIDGWIARVRPYVDFLRSHGLAHLAYAYGFDEVTPPGYGALRAAYDRVRDAIPDLRRAITVGPTEELAACLPELVGAVDIWVPQTDRYDPIYRERAAAGDEVWWYVSMWPRRPFANLFVDYTALEHRVLFWQMFREGIAGFLYYCINLWSSNAEAEPAREREVAALSDPADRAAIARGARWPEAPWNTYTGPTSMNGDGQLVYPGPGMRPLSSVRLECVRAGIEDYELLAALRRAVSRNPSSAHAARAERILALPSELSAGLTRFTRDPRVLLRVRREAGDLIEALERG